MEKEDKDYQQQEVMEQGTETSIKDFLHSIGAEGIEESEGSIAKATIVSKTREEAMSRLAELKEMAQDGGVTIIPGIIQFTPFPEDRFWQVIGFNN